MASRLPSDSLQAEHPHLLSTRTGLLWIGTSTAVLIAAHLAAQALRDGFFPSADIPRWWPVGVFFPRWHTPFAEPWRVAAAVGCLLAYRPVANMVVRPPLARLSWVLAGGLLLILASTMIQGPYDGVAGPVGGWLHGGIQYYHDALLVRSPGAFLNDFNSLQPDLAVHSKTHPPGAVLLYYGLHELLRAPWSIGLTLTITSVSTAGVSLYFLAKRFVHPRAALGALWIYLCIPSTQIYFCSSLDALIAGLCMASVATLLACRGRLLAGVLSGALLYVTSMLTFAFPFVVAVAVIGERLARRTSTRSGVMLMTFVACHLLASGLTDFDYPSAFLFASRSENPFGWMAIGEPVNFVVTRIEALMELGLFLGPIAMALVWRSHRSSDFLRARSLVQLAFTAYGVLFAMLLAGAYRTAELARAAAFIYPFMMLPIAALLDRKATAPDVRGVAQLCFAQSITMQLAGTFFW
jgi:hypothetical protein